MRLDFKQQLVSLVMKLNLSDSFINELWLFSKRLKIYLGRELPLEDIGILDLIVRYIPLGSTVLDIGANIGIYSDRFSRMVGAAGRVVAFEPYPTSFENFKRLYGGV